MSIATVLVSGQLYNPDGSPAALADVRFALSGLGAVGLSLLVPRFAQTQCDASGAFSLAVVPSPAGTYYTVRASWAGVLLLSVRAVVPASNCQLTQIMDVLPLPAVSASEQALLNLRAAQAEIESSRDAAAASAAAANTSRLTADAKAAESLAAQAVTAADRVATGQDKLATAADRALTRLDKSATAADRVQTGADTALTAADRVQTGLDKVATAADRVVTGQDKAATAADRAATGVDKSATAADRIQVGADRVATANDKVNTGLDKAATAADKTQTGLDRTASTADKTQTGLDKTATAADRVVTGQDKAATAADRLVTAADRVATTADRTQTGLDKASAIADRTQTGLDRIATASDKVLTAGDRVQTASDRAATLADKAATAADKSATAADRSQTGLDKAATAADRVATGLDKTATAADRVQTGLDKTATASDRTQTGLDKAATAADRTQTGLDRTAATTQATASAASAASALTSATSATGSANSALAIYGTTAAVQAALTTAANQSQLAQTAAASASSILSQDLSAVSAALHRSPNAITAMCLYNTQFDSDGGAWVDRMQHTSWANEPLNGAWLPGGFATELLARGDNLLLYPEQFDNAAWNSTVTVTPNTALGQDGSTTADTLTPTANDQSAFQTVTGLGSITGLTHSFSVWLRADTAHTATLRMYEGSGATDNTVLDVAVTSVWQRFVLTKQWTVSGNSVRVLVYPKQLGSGAANLAVQVWGAKLNQVGALPSTYSASPELVSNGGFDNGTVGWTFAGSWAVSNGTALHTGTTYDSIAMSAATVSGKVYNFSWTQAGGAGDTFIAGVQASNGTGTFSRVFVATSAATAISLFSGVNGVSFDNISVKEVTTLATPYIPYSTQTNSFYQSSADGKFYKLSATFSALTEVFRGNKAKFPRLSAVVAESGNVTIYDLTETGRPMWMRFAAGSNQYILSAGVAISSVSVMQGELTIGQNNGFGVLRVRFLSDGATLIQSGGTYPYNGRVAARNNAAGTGPIIATPPIVSNIINAVALTVLPDAPIDIATGLQVPTIAVFTAGGISVISDTGAVVNSAATTAFTAGRIDDATITATNNTGALVSVLKPRSLAAGFAMTSYTATTFPALLGVPTIVAGNKALKEFGNATGVTLLKENTSTPSKGISARITGTFNTAHMLSDVRRAYLCNTEVESVTATELTTNGTFDVDTAGWTGNAVGVMSFVAGTLRVTSDTGQAVYQAISTVIGKTYVCKFEVVSAQQGAYFKIGTGIAGNQNFEIYITTSGIYNRVFAALATTTYISLNPNNGAGNYATYDNISVKEVIPDRSYKAASASIFGTLVKSPVA